MTKQIVKVRRNGFSLNYDKEERERLVHYVWAGWETTHCMLILKPERIRIGGALFREDEADLIQFTNIWDLVTCRECLEHKDAYLRTREQVRKEKELLDIH